MRPLFGVVFTPSTPMKDDTLRTAGSVERELREFLLAPAHRGKGDVLRRFDDALDDARILRREEALGHVIDKGPRSRASVARKTSIVVAAVVEHHPQHPAITRDDRFEATGDRTGDGSFLAVAAAAARTSSA